MTLIICRDQHGTCRGGGSEHLPPPACRFAAGSCPKKLWGREEKNLEPQSKVWGESREAAAFI